MRTVRLYGELGKRFGRVHRFAVKTPAEAIRALRANFPGFDRHLIESEARHVGYEVRNGTAVLEHADQVRDPASGEIKIIPKVIGAGGSFGRILLGAALIAASFFVPASIAFAGVTLSGTMFAAGVSLALGGIAQLISPVPESDTKEEPENEPSYQFNGPVNTTAQGQPVPVCYGRLIVGGAVISAGISIEQLKDTAPTKIVLTETHVDLFVNHFSPGVVMTLANYKSFGAVWYSDEYRTTLATPPDEIKSIALIGTGGSLPFYSDKYRLTYFVRSEVPA